MRNSPVPLILALLSAAAGCDREKPQAAPPAPAVIFQSPDGRTLTAEELKAATGMFNYEIVGGDHVPAAARELHQQARAAGANGEYDAALALLNRASEAAPRWPYPVYDTAYTHLLKKDFDRARLYYAKTLELSPRGFFTAITALDTLEREHAGQLPPGLYLAYVSLEWIDDAPKRADLVRQLTERQPGFAPALKERALLTKDDDRERLRWIEKGLAANPDAETKGILLINKALLLNKTGDKDGAVKLLGPLALDPASTFATEQLAKAVLANITAPAKDGR